MVSSTWLKSDNSQDLVLDRRQLEKIAYFDLLPPNLDLHCVVDMHLRRRRLLRLQAAQPASETVT